MFEKEAIDRANRKYPIPCVYDELDVARNRKYEEGFKDGAEFGYSKANERHYVKGGEQRRMTNKELSRWLRENPTREYMWKNDDCSYSDYVYTNHVYLERCADEEVDSSIVIREDDGEWREPLIEAEESNDKE